ncbi:MAG: hypothetical protein ACREC6_10375 [Hyphomicrobiaceae bacterium]
MADTEQDNGAQAGGFGSCCGELKQAMTGDDFDPLIMVGEDGILYLAVGLIDLEDDGSGMVDHPLFYCPFCGTKLQDADDVKAKAISRGQRSGPVSR